VRVADLRLAKRVNGENNEYPIHFRSSATRGHVIVLLLPVCLPPFPPPMSSLSNPRTLGSVKHPAEAPSLQHSFCVHPRPMVCGKRYRIFPLTAVSNPWNSNVLLGT